MNEVAETSPWMPAVAFAIRVGDVVEESRVQTSVRLSQSDAVAHPTSVVEPSQSVKVHRHPTLSAATYGQRDIRAAVCESGG